MSDGVRYRFLPIGVRKSVRPATRPPAMAAPRRSRDHLRIFRLTERPGCASPLRDPPALPGRQQKFDSSRRYVARKFTMLRGVECDSPVNPLRCAQLGSAKLPKPAARVRIGSCRNEFHEIQNHPSEMVLRGRDSVPAAALSGSLFLKPPALPEDIYSRCGGLCSAGGNYRSRRSPVPGLR